MHACRVEWWAKLPARPGPRSKFFRAWELAHGAPVRRRDRMSLKVFRHRLFRITVADTTKDRFQRPIGRAYSTAAVIVERIA